MKKSERDEITFRLLTTLQVPRIIIGVLIHHTPLDNYDSETFRILYSFLSIVDYTQQSDSHSSP
jgi:hypothetical protein